MIHQLIITLTDQQQATLIEKTIAAGNDDDHNFLQQHVNNWLKPTESIGETLAKGLAERMLHTEI